MASTDKPQLPIADLLKAAQLAQIDPATIPSDQTPWSWKDPRAFAWQTAFRSLNPAMAEQAEVAYGPAISLALQAALDGHTEMTPDLTGEYSIKRPLQYEQMQRDQIEAAIKRALMIKAPRAMRNGLAGAPNPLQSWAA
jgi:hypothetical protein